MGAENAALGAGEVILGQLGDLFEEPGASFVVEKPGGKCAGMPGKTFVSLHSYCVIRGIKEHFIGA